MFENQPQSFSTPGRILRAFFNLALSVLFVAGIASLAPRAQTPAASATLRTAESGVAWVGYPEGHLSASAFSRGFSARAQGAL